jgi:glyoxylase-like metal-dependent hydrolase (beta-lactamase superfamily II)
VNFYGIFVEVIRREMKLFSIHTGNFKVDGGAMFGTVPKVLWNKQYPCDENNYCNLSMRSLLVDTGERVFLIDNGMGNKRSETFYSSYFLNREGDLIRSLNKEGYYSEDIADIVLTHLHFDHCGGGVHYNKDRTTLQLTFPNANYWVSRAQWDNYLNPNAFEADAYFPEDLKPVFEAGKLKLINEATELAPGFSVRIFNGHTPGQLVPVISYKGKTLVYAGDLIPLTASIRLLWISAYDANPVVTAMEKEHFLYEAMKNDYILFLEHDAYNECCKVKREYDDFVPGTAGSLTELFR